MREIPSHLFLLLRCCMGPAASCCARWPACCRRTGAARLSTPRRMANRRQFVGKVLRLGGSIKLIYVNATEGDYRKFLQHIHVSIKANWNSSPPSPWNPPKGPPNQMDDAVNKTGERVGPLSRSGYIRGEGAGAALLKPAESAEEARCQRVAEARAARGRGPSGGGLLSRSWEGGGGSVVLVSGVRPAKVRKKLGCWEDKTGGGVPCVFPAVVLLESGGGGFPEFHK